MNQYPRLGPLLRLILIAVLVGPLLIGPLVAIYSELLGILVVELAIVLFVGLFVRYHRFVAEDVLLLNAVRPPVLLAAAATAICAGLAIADLETGSAALLQHLDLAMPLGLQQSMLQIQIVRSAWQGILVAAAVVVSPGIGEELLFRGLVFTGLLVHRGPRVAIVGSALLFAAIHFRPGQLPALMLFGLFLAALVYWTHSIYPAMVAHWTNNLTSVAAVNLEVYWGIEPLAGALHAVLLRAIMLSLAAALGLLWIRRQPPLLPMPAVGGRTAALPT